jgi:hypothetical protein
MARPRTAASAAKKPHPVTIDAVLARWLDGEEIDLSGELRRAAAAARTEEPEPPKRWHWSFLADL